jgi:hypothetical protein
VLTIYRINTGCSNQRIDKANNTPRGSLCDAINLQCLPRNMLEELVDQFTVRSVIAGLAHRTTGVSALFQSGCSFPFCWNAGDTEK